MSATAKIFLHGELLRGATRLTTLAHRHVLWRTVARGVAGRARRRRRHDPGFAAERRRQVRVLRRRRAREAPARRPRERRHRQHVRHVQVERRLGREADVARVHHRRRRAAPHDVRAQVGERRPRPRPEEVEARRDPRDGRRARDAARARRRRVERQAMALGRVRGRERERIREAAARDRREPRRPLHAARAGSLPRRALCTQDEAPRRRSSRRDARLALTPARAATAPAAERGADVGAARDGLLADDAGSCARSCRPDLGGVVRALRCQGRSAPGRGDDTGDPAPPRRRRRRPRWP